MRIEFLLYCITTLERRRRRLAPADAISALRATTSHKCDNALESPAWREIVDRRLFLLLFSCVSLEPRLLIAQAQPKRSLLTASPNLNGKISLPVQDAADAIGVSRSSLYERIKAGDLPSFKSCGRRLIRVAALLEMLDRDEAASQREAANASNRIFTIGSAAKNATMSASCSAAGSA